MNSVFYKKSQKLGALLN